jgi:hypothetical protein
MTSSVTRPPLLSWDGFTARCDLAALHAMVNRDLSARAPALRSLHLDAAEGNLRLEASVVWKAVPFTVSARLSDVRLYRRFFGCRVIATNGPFGLPLPPSALCSILQRALPGRVSYDASDGIFLLDLREHLPAWLDVSVRDAACVDGSLVLRIGPGSLTPQPPALQPVVVDD